MFRYWIGLALLAFIAPAVLADEPKADEIKQRLLGKWALPGKTNDVWEFHADGTITGTKLDNVPTFRAKGTGEVGHWLTYTVGKLDGDVLDLELKVRSVAPDRTETVGVFQAKAEFTRKGRVTITYAASPTTGVPTPFPAGKKLYRPDDLK
jgi:hypothetical protein